MAAAGRQAAPHLKPLLGPWWMAQFDPHADVAAAARAAFQAGGGAGECRRGVDTSVKAFCPNQQACLPARKQLEALAFCRQELAEYLVNNAAVSKDALGDVK